MFLRKEKNNELKKWHLVVLAVVVVVAIIFHFYSAKSAPWQRVNLKIGSSTIPVLVANTYAHRYEGWSDKDSMGDVMGMLFVFDERSQHGMVMRGMRFPLDMVWLDGPTVIDMAQNVPLEPGKSEGQLIPYYARGPSTHVIELPDGFVAKVGLRVGDEIEVVK